MQRKFITAPDLYDDQKIRELNSAFKNLIFPQHVLHWMAENNPYDYMEFLDDDLTEIWIPCLTFSFAFTHQKLYGIFDALPAQVRKINLDGTVSKDGEEKTYQNQMIKMLKATKFATHVTAIGLQQNELFTKSKACFARLMKNIPSFIKSLDLSRNNPFEALTTPARLKAKLLLIPKNIIDIDLSYNLLSHIGIDRENALREALEVITESSTIFFTNLDGNLLEQIGGAFHAWFQDQAFVNYQPTYLGEYSKVSPYHDSLDSSLLEEARQQLVILDSEFDLDQLEDYDLDADPFEPTSEESFIEDSSGEKIPSGHIPYANQRFFTARRIMAPINSLSSSSESDSSSIESDPSPPDDNSSKSAGYSSF